MAEDKGVVPPLTFEPARKNWLKYVRGSFLKYVLIAILPSLVFIMSVFFISPCLSLVILPLIVVVLLWLFRVNNLWHQIISGAISLAIAALLMASIYSVSYGELTGGTFSNDASLTDGKVTPFEGGPNQVYTFSITVEYNATYVDPHVIVYDLYGTNIENLTMTLVSHSANNFTKNYSAQTTLDSPINSFIFSVDIDGTWHSTLWADGPISSDGTLVYMTLAYAWLIQIFGFCFMQLIVMIIFLRMSAKSREVREKMMKDYRQKTGTNVASPSGDKTAPGAEVEAKEDTFICSECGAEVKASAKYCPNCGEPFEEDDEPKAVKVPERK
jgi:hypothetical protein